MKSGHGPEVSRLKLIHTGRILANDKTVADYGVKDGDHMVLMVSPAPSQVKPTTTTTTKSDPKGAKAAEPASSTAATQKSPSEQQPSNGPTIEESAEFKQAVQSILEMGYSDKQIVERALSVAYGNPDRAVELLESVHPFQATVFSYSLLGRNI